MNLEAAMTATRHKSSESFSDKKVNAIRRAVRKAERMAGDGVEISGTGYTILKQKDHPIGKLIEDHDLVPEAITAADEIYTAFHAIASRMMIRPGSLERIDGRGKGGLPWLERTARSVSNYQSFAQYWTKRANLGDPMLEVLIAVVIDERSIRDVAAGLCYHHSRIKRAVIAGLKDYAARIGQVSGAIAERWQSEAEAVFPIIEASSRIASAKLRQAVEAAKDCGE